MKKDEYFEIENLSTIKIKIFVKITNKYKWLIMMIKTTLILIFFLYIIFKIEIFDLFLFEKDIYFGKSI